MKGRFRGALHIYSVARGTLSSCIGCIALPPTLQGLYVMLSSFVSTLYTERMSDVPEICGLAFGRVARQL